MNLNFFFFEKTYLLALSMEKAQKQYSIVDINHMFFIHLSMDGHLDCLRTLAAINSATLKIGSIYLFELLFLFSLNK